jgi:hypothetical protein
MKRAFLTLLGIMMVFFGGLSLAFNLGLPLFGIPFATLSLWPLFVMGLGGFIVMLPLVIRERGMAALFPIGLPIIATGSLLLIGSVFRFWHVFEYLWPVEILSVAVGFVIAALYARTTWLLIPAILIGMNGAVMQFCALTGWWQMWSFLWTIEPLSIGLIMILTGLKVRSTVTAAIGATICGLSILAGAGMAISFSPFWRFANLFGAGVIVLAGALLLVNNLKTQTAQ